MSHNYPDNVNPNSIDCPWNQKDDIHIICPDCECDIICDTCCGDGYITIDDDIEAWE